jgi:hypothetical protein
VQNSSAAGWTGNYIKPFGFAFIVIDIYFACKTCLVISKRNSIRLPAVKSQEGCIFIPASVNKPQVEIHIISARAKAGIDEFPLFVFAERAFALIF